MLLFRGFWFDWFVCVLELIAVTVALDFGLVLIVFVWVPLVVGLLFGFVVCGFEILGIWVQFGLRWALCGLRCVVGVVFV